MSHETTKFFAYSTAVFLSRLLQNDTIGFQIPVRSFVYASASFQARILLVFLFGSQFLQILHRNTVGIAMNFDPDLCLGKKKKNSSDTAIRVVVFIFILFLSHLNSRL